MKDVSRLDRPSPWDLGNEVLYSLCADYPGHADPEVVVAKLWLIGRAYGAPLERGRPKPRAPKNEAFYTGHAVPLVLASDLDRWIADLAGAALTWEDLPRILRTHFRVTELFKSISGRAQRSLASKYLHFHRPALFFIYDSRAAEVARSEWRRPRAVDVRNDEVDRDYALFSRRCLELVERLKDRAPVRLTPRVVDRYLLEY